MTVSHHPRAQLRAQFRDLFGSSVEPLLVEAPGRVNLIGEHTDYNDGWVLPMAIDRFVWVAFARRLEPRIRAHSRVFDETVELALDELQTYRGSQWFSYLAGVAWAIRDAGLEITGMDLLVDGSLPLGSGLSSSAALEMAVARAICAVSGIPWQPMSMARLGQRVENEFIGVSCGVMDQLTSAAAETGSALLLDCRSLETEPVSIPAAVQFVVMDTGAPRSLADSAYNDRRSSCEEALHTLQMIEPELRALRDVHPDLLSRAEGQMSDIAFRRARHVVEENLRPRAFAAALAREDFEQAGRLMNASHASLQGLYEVSSPELDLITNLAREHSECYGARLTGAGFGGSALALIATGAENDFIATTQSAYAAVSGLQGNLFACRAVGGVHLVDRTTTMGALTSFGPED